MLIAIYHKEHRIETCQAFNSLQEKHRVIFITGDMCSGKSTHLKNIFQQFCTTRKIFACTMISNQRVYQSKEPAIFFDAWLLHDEISYPWAKRDSSSSPFSFDQNSFELIKKNWTQHAGQIDFLIIDDFGKQELNGKYFASILQEALDNDEVKTVVLATKPELVTLIKDKFQIEDYGILTMETKPNSARHTSTNDDIEKIAIFATINGLIEVSIGTTLHTLRLPFKGHFLAYVQNFLLLIYGKHLKGRGLFSIAFISAALKSFSPTGSKLKPMLYIFLQGFFLALPSLILGWNFVSALIGSILMAYSTIFVSLIMEYILYGQQIFEAYTNGGNFFLKFVNIGPLSFIQMVSVAVVIKSILAVGVFFFAWYTNADRLLEKLKNRVNLDPSGADYTHKKERFAHSIRHALYELIRPKVLFSIILSLGIILFFTNIKTSEMIQIAFRASVFTYLGLLFARRINFDKITHFLEKMKMEKSAKGLKMALGMLINSKKKD